MASRMVFGRCFESALGPYLRKENCGALLGKERETDRDASLVCKEDETWERLGIRESRGSRSDYFLSRVDRLGGLMRKRERTSPRFWMKASEL